MADQIPTSIQEEISAEYFDVFLSNNWDVSDQKYRKLLSDCFGKNGKFGKATEVMSTTFTGTLSMLGDKLFKFKMDTNKGGFFDFIKGPNNFKAKIQQV